VLFVRDGDFVFTTQQLSQWNGERRFTEPEDLARYTEALRKAGLPE